MATAVLAVVLVELVLGQVRHDTCDIAVAEHVHCSPDAISGGPTRHKYMAQVVGRIDRKGWRERAVSGGLFDCRRQVNVASCTNVTYMKELPVYVTNVTH